MIDITSILLLKRTLLIAAIFVDKTAIQEKPAH